MHAQVFVLGSGSSGNCFVFEAEGERLVVDAGLGPTRAVTHMRRLGAELVTRRPPVGIVVTHEHGDHAAHALPLSRALRAPIFAHDGASLDRVRRRAPISPYIPGRAFVLGPFVVEALGVPHDAPHVALRIGVGSQRVGLATDLGHARRDVRVFLGGCDFVFLEANYCPRMLASGPYPPRLQRRVGGPLGHLGNEQTAELVDALEGTRVGRVALVHLSRSNNTPERALAAVQARARSIAVDVVEHGEPRLFDLSGALAPAASRAGRAEQLAFAFG